jgi:hypothetical protein
MILLNPAAAVAAVVVAAAAAAVGAPIEPRDLVFQGSRRLRSVFSDTLTTSVALSLIRHGMSARIS